LRGRGVETESLFDFELRVPGERQSRYAQRNPCDEEKVGHRQGRSTETEFSKRPWQQAAKQHCDQHHGIKYVNDVSKAAPGQRVINRPAIRRFVHDSSKYWRHFIPVCADVALI